MKCFFQRLSSWWFATMTPTRGPMTTLAELEHAHQKLSEAYAIIQKQALTDALTSLPNHRAVMDQFSKELDRAQRYGRPLSILFFDADRFKRVNDTHGHAAGDAVLCQIGERAGSVLRGGDTLGRFGGEEFVILLPEADAREASVVAERIRAAVAAVPVTTSEVEGGIAVTVSIGLSTYPTDGAGAQSGPHSSGGQADRGGCRTDGALAAGKTTRSSTTGRHHIGASARNLYVAYDLFTIVLAATA